MQSDFILVQECSTKKWCAAIPCEFDEGIFDIIGYGDSQNEALSMALKNAIDTIETSSRLILEILKLTQDGERGHIDEKFFFRKVNIQLPEEHWYNPNPKYGDEYILKEFGSISSDEDGKKWRMAFL